MHLALIELTHVAINQFGELDSNNALHKDKFTTQRLNYTSKLNWCYNLNNAK